MRIEQLELIEVPLRLKRPFRTSGGVTHDRRVLILLLTCEGVTGMAECVAGEDPSYSHETTDTAWHIIEQFLAPNVVGRSFASADDLLQALSFVRGNDMAVAAVEMAYWDLRARTLGVPLFELLGGSPKEIAVGVSIGIQRSAEETVALAEEAVTSGYRRVKLKIEPGWDEQALSAVRAALPEFPLTVDANSAYTLEDASTLARLDAYDLDYMEQPLAHDDLLDHAELQRRITTPVCLDESITSVRSARQALTVEAAKVLNMKVGRVRGFRAALAIHDVAAAFNVPLWCGGMLESGVGRAANLHLSTLPGFRLPGDTSSSSRYWERDIINEPLEATGGYQQVPRHSPGIGVTLDKELVSRLEVRRLTVRA